MSTMVPMYGFGGGIDNLRFRVYAATSLPASGRENDVCIITSTPIPSWEVSKVDNPTWNMNAGFVYLTSVISEWHESPNLLRKNMLYLKLIRCWQYESGKWANKNAYQYRNGAWVQFSTTFRATIHITYPAGSTCTATDGVTTITAPDTSGTWDCVVLNAGTWTVSLDSGFTETIDIVWSGEEHTLDTWHLFRNGDDLTNVTGGWSNSDWTHCNSACGSVTINDGRINFADRSHGWNGGGTVNKIPIDGFKTITLSGLSNGYSSEYWSGIGICSSKNTDSAIAFEKIYADDTTNLTLDVSNVSGSYYIAIMRWLYATEVMLKC